MLRKTTDSGRVRMLIKSSKVTDFKHNGILPIDLINHMPKDVPVLLITSHNDSIVPYECTMNIYNGLRTTGHTKVHILHVVRQGNPCMVPLLQQKRTHLISKPLYMPFINTMATVHCRDSLITELNGLLLNATEPKTNTSTSLH